MAARSKVPFVIIGVLLLMFIALITLLVLSRTIYPVQIETRYMQSYQGVDKSFNQISGDRAKFDALYAAQIATHLHSPEPIAVADTRGGSQNYEHGFTIGTNRFEVVLTDAGAHAVSDATVTGFVSSFHTSDYDQTITLTYEPAQKRYQTQAFEIAAAGRYKITVLVRTADGNSAFFEKAVFAK
ncbi:hypothetical protein AGMMS50229_05030 [Campylobacterota bacterium]|nr:hypothetical protein AGMMS50229_05030 [Campylobacterota bacterium]